MEHSKSAKKRQRQNIKRRARNRRRKVQVKEAVRSFEQALQDGDTASASQRLGAAYKRIDQVAAKGTLHANTAARQKSKLAKKLGAAGK